MFLNEIKWDKDLYFSWIRGKSVSILIIDIFVLKFECKLKE